MIAPISTINSQQNSYVYNNSFKGKNLPKKITITTSNDQFARSAMTNAKLKLFAPIYAGIAALFGKELVYDENTGKLSEINTKENGVLTQRKHFYPNGKKVKEIDEYENGKIKKILYYKPDGKTLDWTIEYDKYQDVTTHYYPDLNKKSYITAQIEHNKSQDVTTYYSDRNLPKTVQIELNDGSNRMQIKRFDPNGRWVTTENYVNDVITDENEWFDDRYVKKNYENGKLSTVKTEFKRSKIKHAIAEYNKQGKLIKATAYKLNLDNELYISSVTDYPGKNIMFTTHFDENGNVQYIEHKNLRTGKIERRYNPK